MYVTSWILHRVGQPWWTPSESKSVRLRTVSHRTRHQRFSTSEPILWHWLYVFIKVSRSCGPGFPSTPWRRPCPGSCSVRSPPSWACVTTTAAAAVKICCGPRRTSREERYGRGNGLSVYSCCLLLLRHQLLLLPLHLVLLLLLLLLLQRLVLLLLVQILVVVQVLVLVRIEFFYYYYYFSSLYVMFCLSGDL